VNIQNKIIIIQIEDVIRKTYNTWKDFSELEENKNIDKYKLFQSNEWIYYKNFIVPFENVELKINKWYDENNKIIILSESGNECEWFKNHYIPYDLICNCFTLYTMITNYVIGNESVFVITNKIQYCIDFSKLNVVYKIFCFRNKFEIEYPISEKINHVNDWIEIKI
jgi:hypothetical protein